MGGLASIGRAFTKILKPNVYKYGKCLGKESQNGIKVYENFEKNGNRVLTSLKNGEVYKTTEISNKNLFSGWSHGTTTRHDVIVRNHETGDIFNSYKGTTKNCKGTRSEFRGTSLMRQNFGEVAALKTQKTYRGNKLVEEYNTKISNEGTLYRCEGKTYNDDSQLYHSTVELRANNYKMPNGQIVNYDRTQHFRPKETNHNQKDLRYFEPTSMRLEITPNGVKQFYSSPNFFEK